VWLVSDTDTLVETREMIVFVGPRLKKGGLVISWTEGNNFFDFMFFA